MKEDILSKWSLKGRKTNDHSILIKGAIYQEDIANVNICTLNNVTPNFIKQISLDIKSADRLQHNNTGYLITPLSQ
jgi:hypothetical protein